MTSRQRRADSLFKWAAAACASAIVLVMAGILFNLVRDSGPSFDKSGFGFLISHAWNPVTQEFGAASSIYGTVVSTVIAMLLAVPLGLIIAVFLVELAPPRVSSLVASAVELLAAIPSIIYGMWGLFVFAPLMSRYAQPALGKTLGWLPLFQGPPMGIGMLTAGIILALMILPFICAVSRDILRMVPAVVKESAHGLGSTNLEVTTRVSIPYAIQGIVGACFLGLGRAIGETMAVTFVIGNDHSFGEPFFKAAASRSLFEAGNTIASTLANEFAEASDPVHMSALVELGLVLFLISAFFQILAHLWLARLAKSAGGAR